MRDNLSICQCSKDLRNHLGERKDDIAFANGGIRKEFVNEMICRFVNARKTYEFTWARGKMISSSQMGK